MKFRAFVENKPWLGTTRLWVSSEDQNGASYMTAPTIKRIPDGFPAEETDFLLEARHGRGDVRAFLQAMLDAAWAEGLRPADFQQRDHAGELAATQAHLADMRALVYADGKYWPALAGPAGLKGVTPP